MIGEPKGDALSEAMQSWQLGWGNQLHGVLTQEFESRRKRKHAFLESGWHNKRIPLVGGGRNSSRTKLITSSAMNIMNVARETGLKDSFVVQCLGWHDSCYLPPKENSGPKPSREGR